MHATAISSFLAAALLLAGCQRGGGDEAASPIRTRSAEVTATAYTLAEEETKQGNVGLTAWGDQLQPGMRAIAVSRDLIARGLTHGTAVHIEGLPGTYTVRDKMNKRWHDKIDIFMPKKSDARQWGKKTVTITWQVAPDDGGQ